MTQVLFRLRPVRIGRKSGAAEYLDLNPTDELADPDPR
jgi:hypothetical protein